MRGRSYDAVVVGGGLGGCLSAALLSQLGRKVILIERNADLGGRVRSASHDGYTLEGGRLIEDTGSGLCRIFEFLGRRIEVGGVSDALPVLIDGEWQHVGRILGSDKTSLKEIIDRITSADYSEFDRYDEIPLRTWLQQQGANRGVIEFFEFLAALEQITDAWSDHSASENLYVRKMHYEEKRVAGYSFWPKGGYRPLLRQLREIIEQNDGEIVTGTEVVRVLIENGETKGVVCRPVEAAADLAFEYGEEISAPVVISTLPVWSVLAILPPGTLPSWYEDLIRACARDEHRACWVGLYAASDEPIIARSEKELCAWMKTPRTGAPGFAFPVSNYDPSVAPPGKHLFVCGFACSARQIRDYGWLRRMFMNIEADLEDMFPAFRKTLWRKKHTVMDEPFGLQGKPGMVGRFRPHFVAPAVDGLFFVSDTFQGRGIGMDKVGRTALSCVERIHGQRLPFFNGTWRY